MHSLRSGWHLLAVIATLAVIHPLFGEDFPQPQETLPGFKAHSVYESRGIENLSLFNGDPQLAIPLGPEYPLGAGVSFQLRAYYSSRFWHMYQTPCGTNPDGTDALRGRAHVRGFSTLGVGWTLELGSIDPAPHANAFARYYSPDGGLHEFVPPADGDLSAPEDDAEIRIQHVPTGGYVVHLADGTSHWLTHHYKRPAPVNDFDFSDVDHHPLYPREDRWGLERITDRFGQQALHVTWAANYPSNDSWKVASIDLRGSSQLISFNWDTHTPAGQLLAWPVLASIDFPIQASASSPLVATFGYSDSGRFRRTAFDAFLVECDETGPRLLDLPFLETITQSTRSYGFEYSLGDSGTGLLRAYRLPTGARVSFEYSEATAGAPCLWGSYALCSTFDELGTSQPTVEGSTDPADRIARIDAFIDNAPAVISRTEFDPTSDTTATTGYERRQFAQPVDPPPPVGPLRDPYRLVRRVIVRSPSGNGSGILATRHLFHVLVKGTGQSGTWVDSVSTGPGVEVERRIYAGDIAAGDSVRSVVQCYDDVFSGTPVTSCGALESDGRITEFTVGTSFKRLSRTTTWYGTNPDDGAAACVGSASSSIACHVQAMTNWDAEAMEYGQEAILAPKSGPSAVFLQPHQTGRRTSTTWDSSIFASSNPELSYWHPKRFTSRTVEDLYDDACPNDPCATTVGAVFAESTGAALSRTEGNGSLTRTTTWGYDANNDPYTETVSGDGFPGQSLLTTRTFQNGLVTSSVRAGVSSGGDWAQFHVTRDPALGLVTASYDPNGPSTSYLYDPLGRLERITPPAEAYTTFAYKDWTSAQPTQGALVVVKRKPVGSDDAADDGEPGVGSGSVEAYEYDGFGRVRRQIRRLPNRLPPYAPDLTPIGSYFAVQLTRRNAAGQVVFASEWVPCDVQISPTDFTGCFSTSPTAGTTFSDFDAFGRALTSVGPDGTVTTKSYDDWSSSANVARDTDTSEETTIQRPSFGSVTSASRKDLFGRALNVAEPVTTPTSGDLDFTQVTSYRYNVFDKVTAVHLLADPSVQVRTFSYNQLGFLASELTPEKGAGSGSGTTTYGEWDLLGNAHTKNVAGTGYSYDFDPLGRLRSASAGGSVYVQQYWDETSASGSNYGRLTRRIGANGSLPTVTERFGYFADTGRLASKTTEFGTGLLSPVNESWHYDDLGQAAAYAHPRASGLFSVMTAFISGFPTVVKANGLPVVQSATYGPSGSLWKYTTGNGTNAGVTTTIGIDETSWMSRPASLHSSEPSGDVFAEQTYTYDGLGNIRSIGADSFEYDSRSRLVAATLDGVGRTYDYDDFGNRLNLGTTTLFVNPAKNQITGDGLGGIYTYDTRGNQTRMGSEVYGWDSADRMISYLKNGDAWTFAYTGENERILKVPPAGLAWAQYTLRDPGARLATEFAGDGTNVKSSGDYVFLGGQLVATWQSCSAGSGQGWQYIVTDHLGTPRVGTNAAAQVVWQKKYWPFGEIAPAQAGGAGSVSFASMETDPKVDALYDSQRYYDHARTHSGDLGRFLSPDVLGGGLEAPDTWNKYTYARNNPLKYVDPDGMAPRRASKTSIIWNRAKHFIERHVRKDVELDASKFKTNDPRRARELIERTAGDPDQVRYQMRNGVERKVSEKAFNKEVGTEGETIVRVVTEEKGGTLEKLITAFPVKDFLLSLIPGVGTAMAAKEVQDTAADLTRTGADAVEKGLQDGVVGESQRRLRKADCDLGSGPCP